MTVREMQYEKIPPKERDELLKGKVRGGSNEASPVVKDLEKGEVVWIAEENGDKLAGLYQTARKKSMSGHMAKVKRKIEGKEVIGHLVWWTKPEAPQEATV